MIILGSVGLGISLLGVLYSFLGSSHHDAKQRSHPNHENFVRTAKPSLEPEEKTYFIPWDGRFAGKTKPTEIIQMTTDGSGAWPDSACPYKTPFFGCTSADKSAGDMYASALCRKNGYRTGKWDEIAYPGCSGISALTCSVVGVCKMRVRNKCNPADTTK